MTYPNDPNPNRTASDRTAGYVPWIIGGVVAVAVIAGIFMWVSPDESTTTASSPAGDRPAAGASTTSTPAGSGTTGAGSAAGSGTTSGSQTTSPPPASR